MEVTKDDILEGRGQKEGRKEGIDDGRKKGREGGERRMLWNASICLYNYLHVFVESGCGSLSAVH